MRPLEGIKVVEVSSWMASPSAGAVLADLGAEVVKVEPLAGDPARGMSRPPKGDDSGVDYGFQADNRGKRSIALDLTADGGQTVLHRLVASTDVFLCNLLPQRQARFGLTADELFAVRPGLVHATLTGYGTTGPEAWRPGYDVTAFFGRAAISDFQMEGDAGPPPLPGPAQGDHTTGLALVAGILAALRLSERTGESQAIETSLFHTAAWTMATVVAPALIDQYQPRRRDRHHLLSAMSNRYPCQDGRWIMINMPEEHWWPKLCKALERPEWADDPRYDNIKSRFDRMPEVVEMLDEVFATRDRAEWAQIFDDNGLIWGPIQSQVDLVQDPQAQAAGLWTEIDHPRAGTFQTPAIPIRIEGADVTPQGPAPELGEHTVEVLTAAGYDEAQLAELRDAGVIS